MASIAAVAEDAGGEAIVLKVVRARREERELRIIRGGTGGQSLPRVVLPEISVGTPGHGEYRDDRKNGIRVSVPKDTKVKTHQIRHKLLQGKGSSVL
jgi:hypothetical protein